MSSPYHTQATPEYNRPDRRNINRRKKFQDSNSPMKIRPFGDLDDFIHKNRELSSRMEEQKRAEKERKMKHKISQKVKNIGAEDWLFNCGGDKFLFSLKVTK
jgi:hypothetical protein